MHAINTSISGTWHWVVNFSRGGQRHSRRFSIRTSTLFALVTLLSACAMPDPPRNYTAQANDARLVLKSINMPMNVDYSVSSSTARCDGFEKVGTVRDSGRGTLLPGIAKMTNVFNKTPTQLDAKVPVDKPVQVKGYGNWFDGASKGACGPLVAKFSVDPSASYLVEFVWSGTVACTLRVSDVSDPAAVKPVPAQMDSCPKPGL